MVLGTSTHEPTYEEVKINLNERIDYYSDMLYASEQTTSIHLVLALSARIGHSFSMPSFKDSIPQHATDLRENWLGFGVAACRKTFLNLST